MSNYASQTSLTQNPISRRAPRRGQALLLAVLLMVFAALIGSTFITVVALNMDRTSSQEARTAAANAARNGVETINYQLLTNGSNWRPEHISPPPAPGDPAYNFYYTPQEQAQGFARISPANTVDQNGDTLIDVVDEWLWLEQEKNAGRPVYVKFPDPRSEQVFDAPTYLAEVRIAQASDGPDKIGMLRLTVVGVSPDNPNVLVTRIGYKGTSQSVENGPFAYAMFLTNWDYRKQDRVSTTATVSGTTVTVADVNGFEPGRMITLQQGTTTQQRIISAVNYTTRVLTLKTAATITGSGIAVRVTNPLMNDLPGNGDAIPRLFDANSMGGASVGGDAWDNTIQQDRQVPFSIMSNSDVVFRGKSAFQLTGAAAVRVAGTISVNYTNTIAELFDGSVRNVMPVSYPVGAEPVVGTGTGAQTRVFDNPNPSLDAPADPSPNRNAQPIPPPDITQSDRYLIKTKYQEGGGQFGYGPGLYIDNAEDIEKVVDGAPSIPFRTLLNSDLHRLWQGKSFPTASTQPTSGNAANPSAAGNMPNGTARHKLIFPRLTAATDGYTFPRAINNANFSLEQKAIRGWKSPTEFVPRGAELVFNGDQVMVTLEDRSDPSTSFLYPNRPNPDKAWKSSTGGDFVDPANPANTLLRKKTYWMTLSYGPTGTTRTFGVPGSTEAVTITDPRPWTGVIYLEGNAKVRGKIGDENVTVVSMGNIYIEGNVTRGGAGRIALLAKKNVVLNPTQFISRVRGAQDRDVADRVLLDNPTPGSNTAPGFGIKVGVGSTVNTIVLKSVTTGTPLTDPFGPTAAFRVGDMVRVGADPLWRRVTGIDEAANSLRLDSALPAAPADDAPIRLFSDPKIVRGTDTALYPVATPTPVPAGTPTPVPNDLQSPDWFYRIADNRDGDVFARDVHLDGVAQPAGNGGFRQVPVRMVGEHRTGVMLQYAPTPTPPLPDPTPTAMPPLPAQHNFLVNQDTNADGQIAPTERLFATAPTVNFPFNHNLMDVTSPAGNDGDTVETLEALRTAFNAAQTGKWDLKYPEALSTAYTMNAARGGVTAARRLASLPISGVGTSTPTQQIINYMDINSAVGSYHKFPLATSVGFFWFNPPIAELTPPSPFIPPAYIGTSWSHTASDNAETTLADFYWYRTAGTSGVDKQQWLRWITRTVNPLNPDPTINGVGNVFMLMRDAAADAAGATTPPTLPPLRVLGLKLERDDFVQTSGTRTYDPVDVTVDATIFAQEGSWFVIPTPINHRTDLNNSGGGATASENALATRMRRLNYRIRISGTIMQNFTPLADEDYDNEETTSDTASTNYARGPMAEWLDTSSHPTRISALTTPIAISNVGQFWRTITYDPGTLAPLDPDLGLTRASLLLPLSPKVEYVN